MTPEEKEELQSFARRLLEVRNRLHLMQKELAEALGYSESFLSQVEAAKTKPGYNFFKQMIERFNVNPVYLLTGQGEMFLEEEKKKMLGEVYKGEEKETVEELLYYLENVPVVRFSVLEYFLNYVHKNKSVIEEELEKSRSKK
jgi:transcriptional regulator with XRE-family HTH domain